MTLTNHTALKIPKLKNPGRSRAKVVPDALEVHTTQAAYLYIGHELVAVHLFNGPAVLPVKWCTGVRSVDLVCDFLVQYGYNVSEGKAAIDAAIESGTILVKNARPGATITLEYRGDIAKTKPKEVK
jgi:hypothetical protein